MISATVTAGVWAEALASPDGAMRRALARIYGAGSSAIEERRPLLLEVVERCAHRFGDRPLRLFRSPGRINLRGMHVDTHGGHLNLMTHQKETVVAVSPAQDDACTFANTDPAFEEVSFRFQPLTDSQGFRGSWTAFLSGESAPNMHPFPRGHWGRYMLGCALRLQHARPDRAVQPLLGVVGSDVPRGAALSSSAALCVAGVSAFAALSGHELAPEELILSARDAEWYAGSRCGVSDQAAMVLGGLQRLVSVALWAEQLDVSPARHLEWPKDLDILVIDSRTARSLSGDAFVEYNRNRFAYSLALEILRQEMRTAGFAKERVEQVDRLSRVSPTFLPELKDPRQFYDLLMQVPEEASIDALRVRYSLSGLDAAFARYFGSVPPESQPRSVPLRGPLLYGVAESERARVFADLIARGAFVRAGRLMSIGHDGDRRRTSDGRPYRFPVDDNALRRYANEGRPLTDCPGAYGASSPVLDSLVDAAQEAGALGASLTGAGIAGAVLALCAVDRTQAVADAVVRHMGSPEYATRAGFPAPLTSAEAQAAVVCHHAPASAGEIQWPG